MDGHHGFHSVVLLLHLQLDDGAGAGVGLGKTAIDCAFGAVDGSTCADASAQTDAASP